LQESLHLGGAVQVHMGYEPQNTIPFRLRGQYFHHTGVILAADLSQKANASPTSSRLRKARNRDVAEERPVVPESWIGRNFSPKEDRSPEQTGGPDLPCGRNFSLF